MFSNSSTCCAALVRAVVAVLLYLALPAVAAAQSDVIRGRVTDVDGQPLSNVRVTATSIPGNVTRTTQTNPQGAFQIVFPGGPGDYIMGYAHYGYAFRQMQVKRLADEAVLLADVRLMPVQLDSVVVQVESQQRVNRNAADPDVGGTERAVTPDLFPPDVQGNIAAMAASLPGVLLVPGIDGEPDGFSVLGLDADQNSVTLNGMQSGVGGLPRDAAVNSSLVTSPFDVSRGGFSGGNFNINTRAGSNFRSRGSSLVFTTPQMQWTDRPGQALGNDYSNFSLSGMASGPLQLNRAFYNVSYQLGRQARDNRTLLGTSDVGLLTAGVAPDSVARFTGLVSGYGIPLGAGPDRSSRLSDSGMLFGSIDLAPPSSASGQAWNLTFNGNWNRQTPVTSSPLALSSTASDRTNWSGGLQARHSAYIGMLLSETSTGVNFSRAYDDPYLDMPAGRVRVNSLFDDGSSGVQTLTFGGNTGMRADTRSLGASLQNSLSWFDSGNRHRIKLTSELQYSGDTREQASNLMGTFFFNSLQDFEAGRPASYSRTLTARERSTGSVSGAISLGDSYRRSQDLQIQYGVRVDGATFTTRPEHNPLVESTFGRRNDELPTPLVFSPRVGFSWTLGRAQEITAFSGAARTPRAVLRGGIGVFASGTSATQVGAALDNTGLPGGVQQIMCVGPAVPTPAWGSFASGPGAVPDRCADGSTGSVFASGAPNVTLYAPGFTPSRTVRSNLSWSGSVLDARYSLGVDATYSLNLNQQRFVDLNFDPTTRFTLADDGRDVYVAPGSIVPATGSIAAGAARVSNSFARVTEMRSDLQSRTAQLSLRLSPIQRTPGRFGWNAAYTLTNVQEQVSGFSSTAGNPLGVEWASSAQGPHQVSYSLRYRLFDAVQLSWNGSFRSGAAFTPMVAGDINGDGYANDRAFIFNPASTSDPALADGMRQLLANAPAGTRSCLEKQLGGIAERNSCRGPWTSNASLNMTLDRAKFRIPQRGAISFSLSNPLGAADLLLNGSDNLRGWGQSGFTDQSLLYVRGFDAQAQQYRYEVNQRFGASRPQFVTLRSPATLTATLRYDLGPTRERQSLGQQMRSGRSQPGMRFPDAMFRSMGTSAILNPMATVLRQQDSLQLSTMQADSIAAMNRRYLYQADSLWAPVARELAAMPDRFDEGAAYNLYLNARRAQVDLLTPLVVATRDLLTPAQRRRLPANVLSFLDPRQLALVRDGTGMYISGAGLAPMGGAGGAIDVIRVMGAGGAMPAMMEVIVR
jgi:hypothetical protein